MNYFACISGLLLAALSTHAENWPQWRGPNFNGSTSEKNAPTDFSRTKNVAWTATMPGPSAATPIIWEDRVFVSSSDKSERKMLAFCLDRKTGKVLWQKDVTEGYAQDEKSNFASPSPVTDGKTVFFFYGNGLLIAYDMAGTKLWDRNIQKDYGQFSFQWTFSSSPTLFGGKLYLQILQRDKPVNGRGKQNAESFLLALNPATGAEIWRQVRPSEAHEESHEAYSTPIPVKVGNDYQMLVVGGDCITGHNAETGAEIWRWGTWNPERINHWRLVPSPVSADGVALACGPKNAPIFAVKLGLKGTLDDSAIAWKSVERDITTDVPTPLYHNGHFFVLNGDKRKVYSLEPKTGAVVWSGDLGRGPKCENSMTAAGDHLYMMDFKGDVYILGAGDKFAVEKVIPMGDEGDDMLRSSISISQGDLFIRTGVHIYCIGSR